ncbi:hypothetical protein AZ019_004104, partial [Klebsiella pneumoniae]
GRAGGGGGGLSFSGHLAPAV